MKRSGILLLAVLFFAISIYSYTQEADVSDTGDDIQSKKVNEKLLKKKAKPPQIIVKKGFEIEKPKVSLPGATVLIKKIKVDKVTLLSKEEVNKIITPYENKNLSLKDMQAVAKEITNLYRKRGYITSGAYIPIQDFKDGVLRIKIIEGVTGKIKIEGLRYFKAFIIRRKITLKKGRPFNVNMLRRDLFRISKHPDRKASAVITPGEKIGITNITVRIKDRPPYHVLLMFDNYGNPHTLYNRYKTYFIFNNITGHDDKLSSKVQKGEARTQNINDVDYVLPITSTLKFEGYYLRKMEDYAAGEQDSDMWKKAHKFILTLTQTLIEEENKELSVYTGFTSKNSYMWQYGKDLCRDRLREIMLGFAFSMDDRFGKTVVTDDILFGIPNYMGSLGNKDDRAFFLGGGGKYVTSRITIARRNKMFLGMQFLFKSKVQFSSHVLEGVDQFAIGGIGGVVDNRGYTRATVLGDTGTSITVGIAFPPYFVSKRIRVPFSKANLYNALKLFIFYDWGRAVLKSPYAGREKSRGLKSIGCGFRMNLPEGFSLRVDLGWPLSIMPRDGDHFHKWIGVSKDFHF